jgi:bifunctional non-homologous end joining protein LigD
VRRYIGDGIDWHAVGIGFTWAAWLVLDELGIIASVNNAIKVRDSRYASGRVNDWVKKTCAQRETLTIAGFALDGDKWDGRYLGRRKGRELVYAGKVDHGFDTASAKDLQARLKPLIRKTQPYSKKIAHRGIWVEPSLLAEIEYRAKSAEGKVRHSVL